MSVVPPPAPGTAGPDADASGPRDEARPVAADLRVGVSIVAALAVIGILLGLVWAAWSPPGSAARITPAGRLQDETEAWVAADGRFLVLSVAVGLVAALAAWRRKAHRGPVVAVALGVGGLVGALLMKFVGWLAGGGSDNGQAGGFIPQQRLSVHMDGLLFLEAGVAVLVYGLLVAFAARDDLGRPDADRDRRLATVVGPPGYGPQAYPPPGYPPPGYGSQSYPQPGSSPQESFPQGPPRPGPSVGPGAHPQDRGGDGDAPGSLQQRDLPPQ